MSRSQVVLSGPLQPHVEGLRAVLVEQGYAPGTLEKYEQLLAVLSGWLQSIGIAPSALTDDVLRQFVRWHAPAPAVVPGLSRVLVFLRSEGVLPAAAISPDLPARRHHHQAESTRADRAAGREEQAAVQAQRPTPGLPRRPVTMPGAIAPVTVADLHQQHCRDGLPGIGARPA